MAAARLEPSSKINRLEVVDRVLRVQEPVEDNRDEPRQSLGIRCAIVGGSESSAVQLAQGQANIDIGVYTRKPRILSGNDACWVTLNCS